MKKKQVLSVSLLSCVLLLGACKAKASTNTTNNDPLSTETSTNTTNNDPLPISHTVTKEQYDKEITNYGFALNTNITYSGTFSLGAMSMSGIVEIDNNAIHTKATGDFGMESYLRIDTNTITEEGTASYEVLSYEHESSGYHYSAGTGILSFAVTESTYMVFIDYEKFSYDATSEAYLLSEEVNVKTPDEDMHVVYGELKFDDGQLVSYRLKYCPVSQPLMLIEVNLVAEKYGSTVVEFPVIVEADETQFNRNVYQRVFFDYKNANATIDAEIDNRGTVSTFNAKFDGTSIETFESIVDGDSSHHYVTFDEDSYNSSTDAIDGLMYYENSDKTWYSMPYSWTYGNYLTSLTYLIPVQFTNVEFVDGIYQTKEEFDYTISGEEFTVKSCTYSFLYGQLKSYSLLAYEKGHLDEAEYKLSVDVTVSNYGTTEVSIPE
jgi:acetone carboxylase gamma subunit